MAYFAVTRHWTLTSINRKQSSIRTKVINILAVFKYSIITDDPKEICSRSADAAETTASIAPLTVRESIESRKQ